MKPKDYNYKEHPFHIVEATGSAYERGLILGAEMQKNIHKECHKILNRVDVEKVLILKDVINKKYPEIEKEIEGRAVAAKVDYLSYLSFLAIETCGKEVYNRNSERCTSVLVNTKQDKIHAHNEDEKIEKDSIRFSLCGEKENQFFDISYANGLSGSSVTVKENFVITMNYIWFDDTKINPKFLPPFLLGALLTSCNTTEEVVETLKENHCATATGYSLCDRKTGKMYYIEKVLDKTDVTEINGIYVHTNHILSESLKEFSPNFKKSIKDFCVNTYNRKMIADGLVGERKTLSEEEVRDILNFYSTCDYNSVMNKGNNGQGTSTFATFVYNQKSDKCFLYMYDKKKNVIEIKI